MGRKEAIARSVVRAITRRRPTQGRSANRLGRILALFSAFFSLYQLPLHKIRPVEFQNIRSEHWNVDDDDYVAAFLNEERDGAALRAMGDMGFSGSVSSDTSIPRSHLPILTMILLDILLHLESTISREVHPATLRTLVLRE